jgi:chromosome segregation ATPase
LREKDEEIASLKEKIAEADKAKRRAEILHKDDVTKIEEQENSIKKLHTSLEATKRNIADKVTENQKILGTLDQLWCNCFAIASRCCETMKKIISLVGATSRAGSFANGDTKGALDWMKNELGALETIINAQSDYCAMVGSRGMASILENVGC